MGVGKTERLGANTSRFTKGRRVDATNDRIIRKLKVHGGRIHKRGDSWEIDVSQAVGGGEVNGDPPVVELPIGDADASERNLISAGLLRSSIQRRDIDGTPVFEIHNFNVPGEVAVADITNANWSVERDRQKVAFRKEDSSGNATLEFGAFNPMPAGKTDGSIVVKWDATALAWEAVPPVDAANDETATLAAYNNRVVVGVETSPNKFLLRLKTAAMPAAPTIPDITMAAVTNGGTGTSPITYVSAVGVDTVDKHKLKVTTKTISVPNADGISLTNGPYSTVTPPNNIIFVESGTRSPTNNHEITLNRKIVFIPPDFRDGYTEGTVIVGVEWNSTAKQIRFKTATAMIKNGSTGSFGAGTNIQFASFAD